MLMTLLYLSMKPEEKEQLVQDSLKEGLNCPQISFSIPCKVFLLPLVGVLDILA